MSNDVFTPPAGVVPSEAQRQALRALASKPVTLPERPIVAIAVPMTTRGINVASIAVSPLMMLVVPGLNELLPDDAIKFKVVIYAGYDDTDPFWHPAKPQETTVGGIGIKFVECPCRNMVCNTNCIMKRAYDDRADFYFRSNDDTGMKRGVNWISAFVNRLASYNPPFLGVVGPTCHQGNNAILTHDFVHRTHMELFDLDYYPPALQNWWCDDWITFVYGRSRTTKEPTIEAKHHVGKLKKVGGSSRYTVDSDIKAPGGPYDMALIGGQLRVRAALDVPCKF